MSFYFKGENLIIVSSTSIVFQIFFHLSFFYTFLDTQSYVDTRHIFLELTYVCENEDGTPLSQTDFVTTTNPNSHTIIDR